MPPVFRGARADTLQALARQLELPVDDFVATDLGLKVDAHAAVHVAGRLA